MSDDDQYELIKSTDIDDINKHVMKVAQTQVKAERDLRGLALFGDIMSNDGVTVAKKKTKVRATCSAMNQVLLEHRDKYEEAQKTSEKFNNALDRYMENDEVDGKTMNMMMIQITKADGVATRELENMGKNITSQTVEINKGSIAMQKMISEVVHLQQKASQHEDKINLAWAHIEKKTGRSREDIERELDEMYGS